MTYIRNKIITAPTKDGDGIQIRGVDGSSDIVHCVVDFSSLPLKQPYQDEAISFVEGPRTYVRHSRFTGAGKLCLCGSGDTPELDKNRGYILFHECIFENFGRRGPEVQDGILVELNMCVIRNWGVPSRFDTRSFGAWAHDGGHIVANECVFWQDSLWPGLKTSLVDIANWIGYSWNRKTFNPTQWFTPGTLRGLTKSQHGRISASRCYKNNRWIQIEGHCGSYMKEKDALALIEYLERKCPKVYPPDK